MSAFEKQGFDCLRKFCSPRVLEPSSMLKMARSPELNLIVRDFFFFFHLPHVYRKILRGKKNNSPGKYVHVHGNNFESYEDSHL